MSTKVNDTLRISLMLAGATASALMAAHVIIMFTIIAITACPTGAILAERAIVEQQHCPDRNPRVEALGTRNNQRV